MTQFPAPDCPLCRAPRVGGLEGCHTILHRLQLEFGLGLRESLGRMAVDAYCLQHPEIYCLSAKSYAAHLAFMAAWMDYSSDMNTIVIALRGFDGPFEEVKPPVLEHRGSLTMADLQSVQTRAELEQKMTAWGQNVWEAYTFLHDTAREYLRETLVRGGWR